MADEAREREEKYVESLRALLKSGDQFGQFDVVLNVALAAREEWARAEERDRHAARIVEGSEGLWCDDFDTDYRFAGTFPADDPAFDEDPPIRAALIRIEEPADG